MEFEYKSLGSTNELQGYLGNEQVVIVPESIQGKTVTSIGKYAFEGKNELLELKLPKSIESIGAHAFYNCRRLQRVSLSDKMVSTGDGAFKNCRCLRYFRIQVYEENMACLKNLLSELNQEIYVEMEYHRADGRIEESHLLFPKYSYEYSENTPARIINQLTFGSGVRYRECMKEKDVDLKQYDAAFSVALLNDSLETLYTIARERLCYPYELSEEAERKYRQYIEAHLLEIVELCLKEEDVEGLIFLGSFDFYTRENIEEVLQMAHDREKTECVSMLLEYKNQHFTKVKKTFEL